MHEFENCLRTLLALGALCGVAATPAQAATAHVTNLTAVKITPPFGPAYNKVTYAYDCSWSDPGRVGIARLDWYQISVYSANLFANNYNTSPVDVSGTTNDQTRPAGTGNYYYCSMTVRATASPFTVFAFHSLTTPGP